MRWTSPIIPSFHPDPSVCRVGERVLVAGAQEFQEHMEHAEPAGGSNGS